DQIPDREGKSVERHPRRAYTVELCQHKRVGEEDRVVEERLRDHQGGAGDRALRVPAEDEAKEPHVAVLRLRHEFDRLVVSDWIERMARFASRFLPLVYFPLAPL